MSLFHIFPILLGLAVVVQSTLNHQFSQQIGLIGAVVINAVVLLTVSTLVLLAVYFQPQWFPAFWTIKRGPMSLWMWVPGFCGFMMVLGIPWSIQQIGATSTLVLLICSQLLFGAIYDVLVLKLSFTMLKFIGCVLALAGALVLISAKKV